MAKTVLPARIRSRSLSQRCQALIRRWFWKMDIAPSAWIAPTTYIDRTYPAGIHIGPDAFIDHEAVILTHDMTRSLKCDTRIGAGSLVGARAVVMPGVTIGKGCTIRPGALVSRDVPDGVCVSGNPAREIEA